MLRKIYNKLINESSVWKLWIQFQNWHRESYARFPLLIQVGDSPLTALHSLDIDLSDIHLFPKIKTWLVAVLVLTAAKEL